MNFTQDDLQNIYLKSSGFKTKSDEAPLNPQEFDDLMVELYKKYPSFKKMDQMEINKAKIYFPTLSEQQIKENWSTILDYTEGLIGYDIAKKVSKNTTKSAKVTNYLGTPLNSCEFWFIADNSRMKDGVKQASEIAFEKERYIMGIDTNSHNGRGDAIRHAIWSIYIGKYACNSYGDIWKAKDKIKGFTNAHECTSPEGAEKQMDLHNNAVGIDYYGMIAKKVKVSCFIICNYNVIVQMSDNDIANNMYYWRGDLVTNDVNIINNTDLWTLVRIENKP